MNPYIFTVNEILDFASPSTLASMIQDIRRLDKGATIEQLDLERQATAALILNVGETEAAKMIGD